MAGSKRHKVVLQLGSFDPVSVGDITLAAELISITDADEVVLVPTGSEYTSIDPTVSALIRFALTNMAIDGTVSPDLPVYVAPAEAWNRSTAEILESSVVASVARLEADDKAVSTLSGAGPHLGSVAFTLFCPEADELEAGRSKPTADRPARRSKPPAPGTEAMLDGSDSELAGVAESVATSVVGVRPSGNELCEALSAGLRSATRLCQGRRLRCRRPNFQSRHQYGDHEIPVEVGGTASSAGSGSSSAWDSSVSWLQYMDPRTTSANRSSQTHSKTGLAAVVSADTASKDHSKQLSVSATDTDAHSPRPQPASHTASGLPVLESIISVPESISSSLSAHETGTSEGSIRKHAEASSGQEHADADAPAWNGRVLMCLPDSESGSAQQDEMPGNSPSQQPQTSSSRSWCVAGPLAVSGSTDGMLETPGGVQKPATIAPTTSQATSPPDALASQSEPTRQSADVVAQASTGGNWISIPPDAGLPVVRAGCDFELTQTGISRAMVTHRLTFEAGETGLMKRQETFPATTSTAAVSHSHALDKSSSQLSSASSVTDGISQVEEPAHAGVLGPATNREALKQFGTRLHGILPRPVVSAIHRYAFYTRVSEESSCHRGPFVCSEVWKAPPVASTAGIALESTATDLHSHGSTRSRQAVESRILPEDLCSRFWFNTAHPSSFCIQGDVVRGICDPRLAADKAEQTAPSNMPSLASTVSWATDQSSQHKASRDQHQPLPGSRGSPSDPLLLAPHKPFSHTGGELLTASVSASTEQAVTARRVAILGGSFAPITKAHLLVAGETLSADLADEVWVVPCGARPDKPSLRLSVAERVMGCFGAVEDSFTHDVAVRVCPLELWVPRALSSFELLYTLSELFQDWRFDLIIGGDLVPSLSRWQHAPSLLRHVSFICVPRPGHEGALHAALALGLGLEPEARIRFLRHGRASMVATMLISSTEIRKRLQAAWARVKHLQDGTVRDHVDLMRSHRARATQTLLPGPAAARVLRYRQFADL